MTFVVREMARTVRSQLQFSAEDLDVLIKNTPEDEPRQLLTAAQTSVRDALRMLDGLIDFAPLPSGAGHEGGGG